MTQNVPIHVFTDETLRKHDEETATATMQVVVKDVLDRVQKMNPAQILNASRHQGKSMYLPPEDIADIVSSLNAKRRARSDGTKVNAGQ
jgi:hypothetical protein